MGIDRPYYRIYREQKAGPNSGYNSTAYIRDPQYAQNAEHYARAFLLIQNDLTSIFEYVEPSDECREAYSYRIHSLLMRTCIEIEANFKSILNENKFTQPKNSLNIKHYRKIDFTHHLSSYEALLPIWNNKPPVLKPFEAWRGVRGKECSNPPSLPWYKAYNDSKHDRHAEFKKANLENLITAVSGLLVLISSQFRSFDFTAGASSLLVSGHDYHPMEAATGALFRIKYPQDWDDSERYEFEWSSLKGQEDRFQKFDYDTVP